MAKEVTLRDLNKAYMVELFSSNIFWIGFSMYLLGMAVSMLILFIGGIVMFIGAIIMMNVDWQGRNKVVKKLKWVK